MAIPDKETIKEAGNVLNKMSSSDRWFFLLMLAITSACMIAVVMVFQHTVEWLVDRFNNTIDKQQVEFITALKEISRK